MAKKLLVDPSIIVGEDLGYQITQVEDAEFDVADPWYWVDGDDSYTHEDGQKWRYWLKSSDNSIVTVPDWPGDAPAGKGWKYNPATNTWDEIDDPNNTGPQDPVIT